MEDPLDFATQQGWPYLVVSAAAIVAGLVIFIVCFRVVRWLVRLLAGVVDTSLNGVPAWITALAAAATFVVVPDVFFWLLEIVRRLVFLVAYDLPGTVFTALGFFVTQCRTMPLEQCVLISTEPFVGFWDSTFQSFLKSLWPPPSFPWGLAVFIVFLTLALGVRRVTPKIARRFRSRRGISLGRGVPLALAILAALYLVITAIIATPVFEQEPGDLQASRERLETSISQIAIPDMEFANQFSVVEDNKQALVSLQARIDGVTTELSGLDVSFMLSSLFDNFERVADQHAREADRLSKRPGTFPKLAAEYRTRLIAQFEYANRGRLGSRQTEQHASEILAHYRAWLSESVAAARRCGSAIDREAQALGDRLSFARGYLAQIELDHAKGQDVSFGLSAIAQAFTPPAVPGGRVPVTASRDAGNLPAVFSLADFCNADLSLELPIPQRNRIADSLGIFGLSSGWLLQTESRDLALITGMLGFGLFGALASSFIRGSTADASGAPQFPSNAALAGIFVRGFSAAILIYLVVVGGLAVFTKSEPAPNAYAVFFACFVAAVFSEDVWNWARSRQNTNLGNGDGAQGGRAGEAPEPDAGDDGNGRKPDTPQGA